MAQNDTQRQQQMDAWLAGPVSKPPPGVSSDFVNGPSLHEYDIICQTICLTLVTLFVAVRIYTKSTVLKSLGWDDATSVVAWLGLIVFGIVILESDRCGNGQHIWNVSGRDFVVCNKLFNGIQITYVLVILLTKVSILLLYLRLFSPTPALRTTIHINLWANAVFYVACIFAVLFICNPRAALWKPDVGLVHCHDQRTVRIASAAVNGISDVAILVIPISVVWRLQMQRKKKLRAIAVLASGLFGCAAGVVRIALITKEFTVQSWNNDQTWNAYPVILWSYAEISLGIICGCMTAVPAFYRHVRDHAAKQQATPFNGKPHERDIIERHLRPTVDVEMTETESTSSLQSR